MAKSWSGLGQNNFMIGYWVWVNHSPCDWALGLSAMIGFGFQLLYDWVMILAWLGLVIGFFKVDRTHWNIPKWHKNARIIQMNYIFQFWWQFYELKAPKRLKIIQKKQKSFSIGYDWVSILGLEYDWVFMIGFGYDWVWVSDWVKKLGDWVPFDWVLGLGLGFLIGNPDWTPCKRVVWRRTPVNTKLKHKQRYRQFLLRRLERWYIQYVFHVSWAMPKWMIWNF